MSQASKQWIVTRKSDGVRVYAYQHPEPIAFTGMEFDTHDHTEVVVQAPAPEAPTGPRRITKLAFRNRFTQGEKAGIEIAALDNPAAPMQQRVQAAGLRATMKDQEVATHIDLDRADTRAGVQMLEAAGLIGPGRALQILDAPVQPAEAFNG